MCSFGSLPWKLSTILHVFCVAKSFHPYVSNFCTGSSFDFAAQQQQQAYTESGQYQRVFTALLPEELRLVLQQGWEALTVAPVFSSDAGNV